MEAAQPRLDPGQLAELAPKTVIVGVLDLGAPEAETAEQVAQRIRAALPYVAADRVIPAPDCGMKYVPRELARAKLGALSAGAALVRDSL